MSHLHIPDGVLPPAVWVAGLGVALALLAVSARRLRSAHPVHVAFRGAMGALVVAAMAIQVPLGALEYHLTLVGPVGVLLGSAAGFQAVFVASAVLAFVGHGGFSVIGLNALVLGAGVACARPAYALVVRRLKPGLSMAVATAAAQAVSGALWLLVVYVGLRVRAGGQPFGPAGVAVAAGIAVPLWWVGVAIESVVALGMAGFLARVRPDLLPRPGDGAGLARAA